MSTKLGKDCDEPCRDEKQIKGNDKPSIVERKTRVIDSKLGGMGRPFLGFGQYVYKVHIGGSSTMILDVKNFFGDSPYNAQVLYPDRSKFAPCINRMPSRKHWLFDWVQVDC